MMHPSSSLRKKNSRIGKKNKRLSFQEAQVKWVPDHLADHCYAPNCQEPFNRFTRRKHHCRSCGNVFCGECTTRKVIVPKLREAEPVKVCENCFQIALREMARGGGNVPVTADTGKPRVASTWAIGSPPVLNTTEEKTQLALFAKVRENVAENMRMAQSNVVLYLGDPKDMDKLMFPPHLDLGSHNKNLSRSEQQTYVRDHAEHQASLRDAFTSGTLLCSNYQLYFVPTEDSIPVVYKAASGEQEEEESVTHIDRTISVPLLAIRKTESSTYDGRDLGVLQVTCKDVRVLRFCFMHLVKGQNFNSFENSFSCIRHYSRTELPAKMQTLFAFKLATDIEQTRDGWYVRNPLKEWERLGIGRVPNDVYRLTKINRSYKFCESYPHALVVPEGITDLELQLVSTFRSKCRIPVLTWRRPPTLAQLNGQEPYKQGGVLIRCAQPLVGITGQRNAEDEKLFMHATLANELKFSTVIVDCRPVANALAQTAMGAGYENVDHYVSSGIKDCRIEFLGIDNIHVMRRSQRAVEKACAASMFGKSTFSWSGLEGSNHFKNLSSVLQGAVYVARCLTDDETVVVHCSDGWDRTAQVCALTQLMLDPHYRTIEGFQTLIDKEWISFGHKFHDRLGHGNAERTERSPVFLQFIDCVYQIWAQFPAHFEFDQRLLIFILDHIYSGKYGNFLVNCEKDNIHFGMANKTRSIWADVNSNRSYWCNDLYGIYKHQDSCLCNRILVPDLTRIVFWDAYYLRWHSCMQKLVINGHTSRTNGGSIKTSTHTQNPERQFVLNVNTQRRRKSHNMFNILLPTDEDAPNLETKEIDTQLPHDFYSIAVKLQNENKAAHTELERLRKLLAEAGIDSTPPVNAPEATEERKQPRTTRGPPPLPRVEEAKRTVVPKTADLLLEESSSSEEGIVVDL